MKSPKIRFKEFQNEWNSRILGEVGEIVAGGDIDKNKILSKGIYPVYANALTNDGIVGYYNDYFRISAPAVTITGRGEVGYAQARFKNFTPVVRLLSLKTNNNVSFIACSINRKKIAVESTSVPQLTKPTLSNIKIRIPSDIKEQEAIGEFFRKMDGILDLENSRFKKLENFKKTMLDKLFVKDGADEPQIRLGSFKGEWNSRILGDIGGTYCGLSGKNKDDFGHGNAKFVPYINIFQNSIVNLAKLEKIEIDKRQNSVKNCDIFFTTSSETPQEIAMSSVYLGNEENIYLNSFCFGFRPKEFLNSYFLAYFFRSHYFRDKVIPLAQGISRYNISKNKMMELKIRIPNDIKEQEKIGEFFRKIDGILEFSQKKITKLENIKKYLLNKMFV